MSQTRNKVVLGSRSKSEPVPFCAAAHAQSSHSVHSIQPYLYSTRRYVFRAI